MAAISVQNIVRTGLEASYTAVAASHTFTNDGKRTFVHVVNGATAMTLTIVSSSTDDGLPVDDRTVSVGANKELFVGPWPTKTYGTTTTIQFNDTTDGTVAAIKVPVE